MGNPYFRVKASGQGGSGYVEPPLAGMEHKMVKNADGDLIPARLGDDGSPLVVPGVTTVLKHANNDALIQWTANQTAAFAAANLDLLASRTEDWGYKFLRFQANRKSVDLDDPMVFAYKRVLNDLAELGTHAHDYFEWCVTNVGFPPTPTNLAEEQMFQAIDHFLFTNDVESVLAEKTVYGDGYAGTFDHILILNGKRVLADAKTSRQIGDHHRRQVAALDAAKRMYEFVDGEWVLAPVPEYEALGFLQIRPDTDEGPAFCAYHPMEMSEVGLHLRAFRASLELAAAERALKDHRKEGK